MKLKKKTNEVSAVITVVIIVVVVAVIFVGGSISFSFNEDSLKVHSSLWKDFSVIYGEIDQVELRDDIEVGVRTLGYGSAKLCMGNFKNSEFGAYKLYAYSKCDSRVLLRLKDGSAVVLGGKDKAESQSIYDSIKAHI